MTPELIQALNPTVTVIVGAVTAYQQKRIHELGKVEGKFRIAIRHIRDWHRWEMTPTERRGPSPSIPDDLIDEV